MNHERSDMKSLNWRMGRLQRFAQWLFLILLLLANEQVGANPLIPANSYDAHIRNLLLSGKVPDALSYAKEHYGRVPAFLERYAAAFTGENQQVGRCQEVAKTLHAGLSRLGGNAEYLAIKVNWDYLGFRLLDGKEKTISHTGYHVVVRVGDMVYDAYTGTAGMRLSEYLSRLIHPAAASLQVVVVSKP